MPGGEDRDQSGTQRIEAFSDGVFAIAITLLILEIRVPHMQGGGDPGLGRALLGLWPSYAAYVFSFVIIGIYWANHHSIFHLYQRSDHPFLLLNVLFLMCVSFLPFPTAVLAQYITDPRYRQASVEFYVAGLLLPAITWLLMWLYGSSGHRLVDKDLDDGYIRMMTRQYVLSSVLDSSALIISFFNWTAALVVSVGLTILYLLPPKKPVYTSDN